MTRWLIGAALVALVSTVLVRYRSERDYAPLHPPVPHGAPATASPIHPGGPAPRMAIAPGSYRETAFDIAQGHALFRSMNCIGCHAQGGGAIGPALMDTGWLYGSSPDEVFATIRDGRPNGMPAFGGKLQEQQLWQLVAYVRTLGGFTSPILRSARSDHMQSTPPWTSFTPDQPDAPELSR